MRARSLRLIYWTLIIASILVVSPNSAEAQRNGGWQAKLDRILQQESSRLTGQSRVIVKYRSIADPRVFGPTGVAGPSIAEDMQIGLVQNRNLATVAADPRVERLMVDRPAFALMQRTSLTSGANDVKNARNGYTGAGIGVAVIDSGVSPVPNDLWSGADRVVHFRDFTLPHRHRQWNSWLPGRRADDPYGHGTHVAGIIAGSGYDSRGEREGIAPGAHLVSLKVLDKDGLGYVSDVIAAIDYAIRIRRAYDIRVINVSVGSGVFESYADDPLTLAARRAVDKGMVVVAAAGNLGRVPDGPNEGETQFGGVTAPGNAPWVLTVGASSHMGSDVRSDDTIAGFSSRGPTWINFLAKPDLVAPGVGIESLSAPGSTLYKEMEAYLLPGTGRDPGYKPYLSLSGTSMAAPVVTGAVAMMFEANPRLTPNAVKAILQYTAQVKPNAHALSQGAGQLNVEGAVRVAKWFGRRNGSTERLGVHSDVIAGEQVAWSEHIIWGNYRVSGGMLLPGASAFADNQQWGAMTTPAGDEVAWGADDSDGNIVWSTDSDGNIVWSTNDSDSNIVWSTDDDGNIVWSTHDDDGNIVWSTDDDSNIVWSTEDDGNIVWSTGEVGDDANIVWSTDDDGNIVWSTEYDDSNIVWSTGEPPVGVRVIWTVDDDGNIVWSTYDEDMNIVWSTDDDGNIVWSTDDDGNIVWSTDDDGNIVWSTDDDGNIVWSTHDDDSNIVWSTAVAQNVIWGNDCGGRNCPQTLWGALQPNGTGVWGTLDDDGNIVWSTDDDGNIVWSTYDDDGNIVWSTENDGNIVWSTEDDGNIVWSTDDDGNIVWSTDDDGNIVWSTDDDGNIVWSTNDGSNIVWSTGAPQQTLWPAGQ